MVMSTRHELPGKFVPSDRALRRLWRDVFPPVGLRQDRARDRTVEQRTSPGRLSRDA